MSTLETFIKLKNGRQIGFAEYGDAKGAPIFYFHGLPGSRLEPARFHQIAVANGYRLIGVERPGMGLSSIDKNRSILSWAEDIADVADYLGIEKFSIIGHSGGGPFVAACAHEIPDRLTGATIVSGMAPVEKPESQIGMSRGLKIANKMMAAVPGIATLMMWLTLMMLKSPDKMMKQMVKQMPEVDQNVFHDPANSSALLQSTLEAFRNGLAGPAQEIKLLLKPWGFDLEKVTYPVSIWHGTLDKQAPVSHGKLYAHLLPHTKLHIIENEGHHSLIANYIEEIMGEWIKNKS